MIFEAIKIKNTCQLNIIKINVDLALANLFLFPKQKKTIERKKKM